MAHQHDKLAFLLDKGLWRWHHHRALHDGLFLGWRARLPGEPSTRHLRPPLIYTKLPNAAFFHSRRLHLNWVHV